MSGTPNFSYLCPSDRGEGGGAAVAHKEGGGAALAPPPLQLRYRRKRGQEAERGGRESRGLGVCVHSGLTALCV